MFRSSKSSQTSTVSRYGDQCGIEIILHGVCLSQQGKAGKTKAKPELFEDGGSANGGGRQRAVEGGQRGKIRDDINFTSTWMDNTCPPSDYDHARQAKAP